MKRSNAVWIVTGVTLAVIACASAGGRNARRAACVLPARDSVFAAVGPVFLDCGVDRVASLLTTNIHPDFSPAERSECYSADLEFVVDPTGKPETLTARVVRTNDQAFGESALAMLGKWRYAPALRGGTPVRQIVTTHQKIMTMVALIPAGSAAPSRPPKGAQPPC